MADRRPLHAVFLERVIQTRAVQRHRAAAKDESAADFFTAGGRPWEGYLWPFDALPPPPAKDLSEYGGPPAWSPALQAAWAAVQSPWRAFVAALCSGALVATGRHAASGVRDIIDPVEFARTGLVLDVRNGDLLDGKRRPLWSSLVVQEAGQAPAVTTAAHNSARGERSEKKEEKKRICQATAATLVEETPALENMPTTLARRVEQRCRRELERLGHKKTKYSHKTIAGYLRQRK